MRAPRPAAAVVFFPLAAAYGAVAVPLSVHGMAGGWALPGLVTPAGHAHELFFGYALAVVTGFLVTRIGRGALALLASLWLAARVAFLAAPGGLPALLCNGAFALAVAYRTVPPFMRAAKKWRNAAIGPLVLAVCATGAAFGLVVGASPGGLAGALERIALVLFSLLLLVFGGRVIAPAVAGAQERVGRELRARVQPRIEGALIVLMAVAAVMAGWSAGGPALGLLLMVAGALALLRLLRWRMWRCWRRVDLLCLAWGYAWLGAGLLLHGAELAWGIGLSANTALHAITVGALGTLTTNVMGRTRLVQRRASPAAASVPLALITALISSAAVLRIAVPHAWPALMAAAALWSAAMVLLLVVLLGGAPVPAAGRPAEAAS